MSEIFKQLRAMQATMYESLSVEILIASIEVIEMHPVVFSIKTLADADVKRESLSDRLI